MLGRREVRNPPERSENNSNIPTMPFGDIVMLTRFRGAEQSKVEL